MKHAVTIIAAFVTLVAPTRATAQDTFHPGIKFLGGIGLPDFNAHEQSDDSLTVTADSIICDFGDTTLTRLAFPVAAVTEIVYGQATTRHVARWVTLGAIVTPYALLGLFHHPRHHFVTVSWMEGDRERGVYFEADKGLKGDKGLIGHLLKTLSYRTGKPILADQKDREFLFTKGVAAQLLESKDEEK